MDMNMLPVCLVEIQELQCVIREGRHTHSNYIRPGFLDVVVHHLNYVQGSLGLLVARYPDLSDEEVQRAKDCIRVSIEAGDEFLSVVLNVFRDAQRALNHPAPSCSDNRRRLALLCTEEAIEVVSRERQETESMIARWSEEHGLLDSYLASSRRVADEASRRLWASERIFLNPPRDAPPPSRAIQVSFGCTYRAFMIDDPVPSPVPETCKGCQNYHGKTHGGNLLVCAIHPYGFDGESCPDFAKKEVKGMSESLSRAVLAQVFIPSQVDLYQAINGNQGSENQG